jgi:ubiquinone biosynthesis O-methyltransferase
MAFSRNDDDERHGRPAPAVERQFWNTWNRDAREERPLDDPSQARAAFVSGAVRQYVPPAGRLVDLGCGTGWLSERLADYVASVTAVDLADEVIARAQARAPHVRFLAGSAMEVPNDDGYDAVVCVETFSHVPDQPAFVNRMADLLKPGGWLILTTQNYTVFSRSRGVMPQGKGQIRRWVTPSDLRRLIAPRFRVVTLATIMPAGDRGFLRLLNGRKTCRVWNALLGSERWRSLREGAGLGQTITLVAQKS